MTVEGQRLGPYLLHEVIGSGGFATVYRGTHEALGVDRAIKVLRDDYATDAQV